MTQKLKILQMCAVDFTVKQFLLPLVQALRNEGHSVDIACTEGLYTPELRNAGFVIINNPVSRSMNALSHFRSIIRTFHLVRREQYDVVHVHTPIAALIGRIAARLAGVPVKIYTAHGFYFHDEMPPLKKKIYVMLERIGALCGDFIMTVSAEDENAAKRLHLAPRQNVETIFNGVDAKRFDCARVSDSQKTELRSRYEIPSNAVVIGIVGRLVREKGFLELFEAFAAVVQKHPEVRLLIVGDVLPSDYDGDSKLFRTRIEEFGIASQVTFAGMVNDTAPLLAIMDIFCLPSYREGMPVSLLEAMAMSLPVIATNIRGCREEVVEGETGLLVPTRDSSSLADALDTLVSSQQTRRDMGAKGRSRILEFFEIDNVVAHQLAIYDRLVAEKIVPGR